MWAFLKKAFHFVSTVFLYSVFIIMIIVFLAIGAYFVDQAIGKKGNGEYRSPLFGAYVIISPSMVPNINVYDVVVTMRRDPNKIKVDDIITFISEDAKNPGVTITHRVVGIVDLENGRKAFRTKGDGNNVEDSTLVNDDHLIGKVLFKVPQLGQVQRILTNFSGWLLLIVIPCVGIVLYDLVKLILLIIKKGDDDEDPEDSESKLKEKLKKSDAKDTESSTTQVQKLEENIPIASSFVMPLPIEPVELSKPIQVGDVLPLSSLDEEKKSEMKVDVRSPSSIEVEEIQDIEESNDHLELSQVSPIIESPVLNSVQDFFEPILSESIPTLESKEHMTEEIELLDDGLEEVVSPVQDINPGFVAVEQIESDPPCMVMPVESPIFPQLPTNPIVIELPEESSPVVEPSNMFAPLPKLEGTVPLVAYEDKMPMLPNVQLEALPLPPVVVDLSEKNVTEPIKNEINLEKVIPSVESHPPLAVFKEREIVLPTPKLGTLPLPPQEESPVPLTSTLAVSPPKLPKAQLKAISPKKPQSATTKKKNSKKSTKKPNRKVRR